MRRVLIHMGELYASREPVMVETVLGSCVAACLFDPIHHVGGMNHFLLPHSHHDDPVLTRYGVHAMEDLLRRILKLGAARGNLRAKVFGAANVLTLGEMRLNVSRANERFIREVLAEEEIPLVAERLGGRQALKIRMFTATGKVLVRELPEREIPSVAGIESEQCTAALARRWSWFDEGRELVGSKSES